MGAPVKLTVQGQTVFVCCEGCTKRALDDPKKTLQAIERLEESSSAPAEKTP
jgi:hypothetical protein